MFSTISGTMVDQKKNKKPRSFGFSSYVMHLLFDIWPNIRIRKLKLKLLRTHFYYALSCSHTYAMLLT